MDSIVPGIGLLLVLGSFLLVVCGTILLVISPILIWLSVKKCAMETERIATAFEMVLKTRPGFTTPPKLP